MLIKLVDLFYGLRPKLVNLYRFILFLTQIKFLLIFYKPQHQAFHCNGFDTECSHLSFFGEIESHVSIAINNKNIITTEKNTNISIYV